MSKALENQQKRLKEYSDGLKKLREEHTRYLACLLSIENYSGDLTVAEIKFVVHQTLHTVETKAAVAEEAKSNG